MNNFKLKVLGVDIAFRAQKEPAEIEQAKEFVEEQFERLQSHSGKFTKDELLALLVLGFAGDLLQSVKRLESMENRVDNLLKMIEEKTDILG